MERETEDLTGEQFEEKLQSDEEKAVENETQSEECKDESLSENRTENTIEGFQEKDLENWPDETEKLAEDKTKEKLESKLEELEELEELGDKLEDKSEEKPKNKSEEVQGDKAEKELEKQEKGAAEQPAEKLKQIAEHKPIKKSDKVFVITTALLCTLLGFYLGVTLFFANHFYFGSKINGIDVAGVSVKDAEKMMTADLQNYMLSLKERGSKTEQIKASDVGLTFSSNEVFKELKNSQNPFGWIVSCFDKSHLEMKADITYDDKLLKEQIDKLSCFKSSNIIEPKNPSFKYKGNAYAIVAEVPGSKVDKGILYADIKEALIKEQTGIDFDTIDCYIKPQYTAKSPEVIKAKDILNKYLSSKIIYIVNNNEEIVDGTITHTWLSVDKNFEVCVDNKKAEAYIDALSKKYDAADRIRNFVTSTGETVKVSGGDFSRPINKAQETKALIAAIKEGTAITRQPLYEGQTAFEGNDDIGRTYVEISLTKQHLWFYKNGVLVVQGDVVTGNLRTNHATPPGVYRLKFKKKDAVLRGPGYAAPVNYWMPFNGGIGIHDASWKSVFGGQIYKTNGSHGCINCPNSLAAAIFNSIEPDTPIVCY